MDRRKSLKTIAIGTLAGGVLLDACKPSDKKEALKNATEHGAEFTLDRMPEEKALFDKNIADKFFTAHEMKTITVLGDIIIPKDAVSGSASDAGVPDFIEFIVKDMPQHQIPVRGGLRWLDIQCLKRYEHSFVDCSDQQRMEMVNEIAWPQKAKPEMTQGVSFFNLVRNLTVTGFYTSKIGVADLGYMGNKPNKWNGVPDEVLQQYQVTYSEKEMKECARYD